MRLKKIVFLFVLFITVCKMPSAFAETPSVNTANAIEGEKYSVWKDIRRAEIITLGAIPFVTIFTMLGFSIANYIIHDYDPFYTPNPFAKDKAGFSQDDQIKILLTTLGISLGIGLTDLTIRLVQRSVAKKRAAEREQRDIKITPVALDKTATKLPPPKRLATNRYAKNTTYR